MARAREVAAAAGVTVSGSSIIAPAEPPAGADDAVVETCNARIRAWNTAVAHHDDARLKENEAHSGLEASMREAVDVGWLEQLLVTLGVLPSGGADKTARAGWGLGLTATASGGLAKGQPQARLGYWSPRDAAGNYVRPDSLSRWQTAVMSGDERNWREHRRLGNNRSAWLKGGKFIKGVGGPLTFATAGYEQYSDDAADGSLSGAERAGRATTVGLSAAGGAVGGIAGGVAGSELGGAMKGFVGDGADAVWDSAKDAGSVLKDAGSKLKFW